MRDVENGMVTDFWYTPPGYWDEPSEEEEEYDEWEDGYEGDE